MMTFGLTILLTYLICHHLSSHFITYLISSLIFIYTILIGFSRLYVSAHYLGDILGGFLVATTITCLILALFEWIFSVPYSNQKEETSSR